MLAKLITITEPTSTTGDVAVTGVGLGGAAQAIIFLSSSINAVGAGGDFADIFGCATATGAGNQWVRTNFGINGATGSPYAHHDLDDTKCIRFVDGTGTTLNAASLKSFDGSDGNFTLTWSNSTTSAYKITALVLGGLTSAKASTFQRRSGTGSQTVSTGFACTDNNAVLFMAGGMNDATAPPIGASTRLYGNIGIATSAAQMRAASAMLTGLTAGASECARLQLPKAVISGSGGSIADFTSWHATDGFTLNFTTAAGAQSYIGYLVLKGGKHYVSSSNQPTSAGNQSFSGTGVAPLGGLFWSVNAVTSSSQDTGDAKFSIGIGLSASNMASHFSGIKHGVTTFDASHDYRTDSVLKMMTQAGASPTTQAAAEYVSNDSDGVTIHWTSPDGTAREFNFWLFGAASGGGGGGGGINDAELVDRGAFRGVQRGGR